VTLTFDILTPRSNQHIYECKYTSVIKMREIPFICFEMWCLQDFSGRTDSSRTHALTNSLTDGQTRIQYASGTVFQRWRRHKSGGGSVGECCSVCTHSESYGLFTPPTRTRRNSVETRQNCLVGGVNTIGDQTKLSCLVASAVRISH